MTKCIICARDGKTENHHTNYEKNIIMKVCKSCHEDIHHTNMLPEFKPVNKRFPGMTQVNIDLPYKVHKEAKKNSIDNDMKLKDYIVQAIKNFNEALEK